jgi:predicted acyl esterase
MILQMDRCEIAFGQIGYEMLLEQNADVPVRDGAILHANVYRPNADGRFPLLMTFGPYGCGNLCRRLGTD